MSKISTCFVAAAIAAISVLPAAGRQLSPSEALGRAVPMAKNSVMTTGADAAPKLVMTSAEDGLNTLYVFDRGTDAGFLVVAADDAAGTALLGYSDKGAFPVADMPDNMKWWLGQYSAEIAMAVSGQTIAVQADSDASADRAPIEALVKTQWYQTAPYNNLCPEVDGEHCPTGCVATAMAQVMNYHRWPERGVGSHSYRATYLGTELSFNFDSTEFKWDDMVPKYSAVDYTAEQADAVATLMYACGVAVNMNYEPTSSGGNYMTASRSLLKYLDYDKGIRCLSREYFELNEWEDLVYGEIAAGRPVLYSGMNDSEGHAFIADGYSADGFFHFNWGWDGMSDGYFQLTALNPEQQGVGGSAGGFNLGQQICIGVQPPVSGSSVFPVVEFVSNFATSASSYPRPYAQVQFKDSRGIFVESVAECKAAMGAKLTDSLGNVSYVAAGQKEYISGQGFLKYVIPTADFPESGEYIVTPAVQAENGQWYDACVGMSYVRSLRLKATPDSLVFEPTEEPVVKATELELMSPVYPGKTGGVRARLTNVSDKEFYEEVIPVLEQDDAEKGQQVAVAVELEPGTSEVFEWVGEFSSSLTPGDYMLYLVDSHGVRLGEGIAVTVEAAPTEATQYAVSTKIVGGTGEGLTAESPALVSGDIFQAQTSVSCQSGYFATYVNGLVMTAARSGITEIAGPFVGIKAGENQTVDFAESLPMLTAGETYCFIPRTSDNVEIGNTVYFSTSTAGIEEIGTDGVARLTVWPNPSADVVNVETDGDISQIECYSLSGEMVGRSHDQQIRIADLPSGMYLLRVVMADGRFAVAKIIRM